MKKKTLFTEVFDMKNIIKKVGLGSLWGGITLGGMVAGTIGLVKFYNTILGE